MTYSVKEVAELTGIHRPTLLAWERRYDFVIPARRPNGYRAYSNEEVAKLLDLKRLVDQGHKVADAISILNGTRAGPHHEYTGDIDNLCEDLTTALLASDTAKVQYLTELLAQFDYDTVIKKVYIPILARLGKAWTDEYCSDALKNNTTTFFRQHVLNLFACGPDDNSGHRRVLCLHYPGDNDDIAMLTLVVQLTQRGFACEVVQGNTDLDSICAKLHATQPSMLVVSVMNAHNTPELVYFARKIIDAAPDDCTLVVCGQGLPTPVPLAPFRMEWCHTLGPLLETLDTAA